jgi:hypothetical protein
VAQTRAVILTLTKFALGILGLALLRWTPTSGKGILVYALLFVVAITIAVALSRDRQREG